MPGALNGEPPTLSLNQDDPLVTAACLIFNPSFMRQTKLHNLPLA